MSGVDLDTLRQQHPEGATVTLHRLTPPVSASTRERELLEEMMGAHVGRTGTVQRWATGTRGPQVLVAFEGAVWWLEAAEIREEAA